MEILLLGVCVFGPPFKLYLLFQFLQNNDVILATPFIDNDCAGKPHNRKRVRLVQVSVWKVGNDLLRKVTLIKESDRSSIPCCFYFWTKCSGMILRVGGGHSYCNLCP